MLRAGFLIVLLYLAGGAASAEEWTRFRGPSGTGIASDGGYPVEFGPEKNVLWRTAVRPGKSSPVLTKTHVLVTAAEQGRLYLQCLDRATGELVWERTVVRPREEIANRLNHEAAITPVTDGENVFAFFKDFGLIAYSSDGELLWECPLGPFVNLMGLSASPVLAEDDVVLLVDQWEGSFLAAFDRATGEMRWKQARTEGDGWATPFLHAGRVVTTGRGMLGLHDAATGERVGTQGGLAQTIVGSPVAAGDVVYVFGYGNSGERIGDFASVLAKKDKNGDGRLTRDEYGEEVIANHYAKLAGNRDGVLDPEDWETFRRGTLGPAGLSALRLTPDGAEEVWRRDGNFNYVIPSLLVYDGVLYGVKSGGILTTWDAATGEELGVARLRGALGGYSASPVAAEGRIWFASEEGNVAVVRAGRDWTVEAVNELGEGMFATPALSSGVIYLRTEAAVWAFGE